MNKPLLSCLICCLLGSVSVSGQLFKKKKKNNRADVTQEQVRTPRQQNRPSGLPKHELRGVWIASVNNIDFPEKPTRNSIALQEQWKKLLDKHQKIGINAVVVQVRPAGDALYPTVHAPWSYWLTGQQGIAPTRDFDPLEFMIREAHYRGMEFHAWMNPYRLSMNLDTTTLADRHPFYRYRDWVLRYGNKYYFDPGIPEVRDHLAQVVEEVVTTYDVDAIHFDDYFYPYQTPGENFPDTTSFFTYGNEFANIGDWRRSNTDSLIQRVHERIKARKPHVRFGISPFGVWRNVQNDPMGSLTQAGVTSYDGLYADVLKWLKEGWIDYVAPQLYWNIGFGPADHEILVNWWKDHTYGRDLYIGHAVYKIDSDKNPEWSDPRELGRQLLLARHVPEVDGSILFSSRQILRNPLGVADSMKQVYYREPALPPIVENSVLPQPAVPKLKRVGARKGIPQVKFRPNATDRETAPAYYVVYRFEGDRVGDTNDPKNILLTLPINIPFKRACDVTAKPGKVYTYVVTAVNRANQESKPSRKRTIIVRENSVKNVKYVDESYLKEIAQQRERPVR